MGYTTEFEGSVKVSPPLNEHEISFLRDFNRTRRMNRTKGPLFVKGSGEFGQVRDEDIIDFNGPHPDQPGLWCQWTTNEEGTEIFWDGGEKFYYAAEWMEYLLRNLFSADAAGYLLEHRHEDERLVHFTFDHNFSGRIEAQGEDPEDRWTIEVETK